jgi:hypothetical protein
MRDVYGKNAALRKQVDRPLQLSRMFVRYLASGGDELLAQAWMDSNRGLNDAIAVYGIDAAPRYPQIDSLPHKTQLGPTAIVTPGWVAMPLT